MERERAMRLLSAPGVGSFAILSKGQLVYTSDREGVSDIYIAGRDARLFAEKKARLAPVAAGDADVFLFFTDFEGDECFDIHLASPDGRERNLTPSTPYSILPNASISSDAGRIAFVSDSEGTFNSSVMDVRTGNIRKITANSSDSVASISPDGGLVAVTSQGDEVDSEMRIYDAQGHALLTVMEGGNVIEADEPSWFPDSRRLCFSSYHAEHSDIGILSIPDGSITWITEGKADCFLPSVSRGGDAVAYLRCSGGNMSLWTHSLSTQMSRMLVEEGYADTPVFSHDDATLFFIHESPSSVREIWSLHRATGNRRKLTSHATFPDFKFVRGREVMCNSRDGKRIPSLLFTPQGHAVAGAVYIHGGPASFTLNYWLPLIQLLVDCGIAVIAPNYRGSTGYGREFRDGNRFVMGDLDVADCVAAREYLVSNGIAPADRIGVTGASFGGYLTMCCLTFHPEMWKCGSAVVPFMNWFTEIESERSDLRSWDTRNMGDVVRDEERLRKASPYFFLEQLRAPVQIISGEHDPRCPKSESDAAVARLRELGKEVDYICYRGEGHSFRSVENRADADYRCLSFLVSHLV